MYAKTSRCEFTPGRRSPAGDRPEPHFRRPRGEYLGKFNRTEYVRPIPPDDPAFADLFRRRNDAESINRALEDTLWLGRAHSLGHRRQLLNLLGYALMVNSLAVSRHRQRQQLAA